MHIYGASHVHGPHGVNAPHAPRAGQSAAPAQPSQVDQLDISPEAAAASRSGDVRAELVGRIKAEIASGAYETPEKLDGALNRLLDEIG